MDRHDLEIQVVRETVRILVLDARIRKLHVSVLDRQVMLARPVLDLPSTTVGTTVLVRPTAIARLEESLVVALQLVVEDDPFDAGAARLEPCGFGCVGPEIWTSCSSSRDFLS
jgi:hypothetical protein